FAAAEALCCHCCRRDRLHAATIVVGGKKGWPGVKHWKKPAKGFHPADVLVFQWGTALSGIYGRMHSVALPKDADAFTNCNTKAVAAMVVKPLRKAKMSYFLANPDSFFSTVGKDCAKHGMKLSISSGPPQN
ncbi:unnamed protein product, partial [Closterium sp. NIES-53]